MLGPKCFGLWLESSGLELRGMDGDLSCGSGAVWERSGVLVGLSRLRKLVSDRQVSMWGKSWSSAGTLPGRNSLWALGLRHSSTMLRSGRMRRHCCTAASTDRASAST